MTALPAWNGWIRHFLLTIHLNFRNSQAIVYGYLVPIIFLLAFGSVFRADSPPLLAQMGQIVTITILGGACFGLPTALVAEREQGIWRRYRLLPVPIPWLVFSAMLARVLIVASSILVQIALARAIFGTPFPSHPGAAMLAFLFVTAAFLGIGLLIAALADSVPAVQALGQCIFLPMIMIGGVGVPLTALPDWAQHVAGFMPGRYAVEVLQPCFDGRNGLPGAGFRLGALGVIGLAAGVAAARLFRWEAGARIGRPARLWVAAALTAWISVAVVLEHLSHQPVRDSGYFHQPEVRRRVVVEILAEPQAVDEWKVLQVEIGAVGKAVARVELVGGMDVNQRSRTAAREDLANPFHGSSVEGDVIQVDAVNANRSEEHTS